MKTAHVLLAAAGAAILALPAAARAEKAQPAQSRASDLGCFLRRDIQNHTVGDDHTLYFRVLGKGVYRATMSNACLAAAVSSDPIEMIDRTGSGRICHKMDFEVGVRGSRCIVDRIDLLTPAEADALPRRQKP